MRVSKNYLTSPNTLSKECETFYKDEQILEHISTLLTMMSYMNCKIIRVLRNTENYKYKYQYDFARV